MTKPSPTCTGVLHCGSLHGWNAHDTMAAGIALLIAAVIIYLIKR